MSQTELSHAEKQQQENEARFGGSHIAKYERIIKAATTLSPDEKLALGKWEKENVTGDGKFGTSDWPGWDAVISRISH